ncbi:MAG TPA: hypothetical protein VFB14_13410 [Bryobacteraceae bacterium]|jgi:hypothetical protein|nr:hypothetical protein [Bryobacteraceae bacterium]
MSARQARKARRAAEREARKLAEKQQISEAKLAANRSNAEKSTGPKSEEGKARSSRNSFKHGLYSKQLVLPGEDPAELNQLKADLFAEHQPINTTEELLVSEMAEQYWRIRRFRQHEAKAWETPDTDRCLKLLSQIQRLMSAAERGFHKALSALRQLQKARGFVPTNSAPTDSPASPERLPAEPRPKQAASKPIVEGCELIARSGFVPQSIQNPGCQGGGGYTGFVPQTPF